MSFAVEIPSDDRAAALEVLALVTEWKQPVGRSYFTGLLRSDCHPLLAGCRRAFFLKIESGGNIHRHTDIAADAFDSDLIVVSTNDQCLTCWEVDGVERSMHLELGKRYRLEGRHLPHWATNDGDTDRAHLVIEYPKHF